MRGQQNFKINQLIRTRIISAHRYRLGQHHFFQIYVLLLVQRNFDYELVWFLVSHPLELNQEYLTVSPSPPMPYPERFGFCSFPILHSTNILDCAINRAPAVSDRPSVWTPQLESSWQKLRSQIKSAKHTPEQFVLHWGTGRDLLVYTGNL